jgi:hypothetical protein
MYTDLRNGQNGYVTENEYINMERVRKRILSQTTEKGKMQTKVNNAVPNMLPFTHPTHGSAMPSMQRFKCM